MRLSIGKNIIIYLVIINLLTLSLLKPVIPRLFNTESGPGIALFIYIFSSVSMILTAAGVFILTRPKRHLTPIIKRCDEVSGEIKDLKTELHQNSSGRYRHLTNSINTMITGLNTVMKDIRNSSVRFNLFTKDINSSADKLSENTEKQSRNMSEIIKELESYEQELLELSRKSGRIHEVSGKVDEFTRNLITGFQNTARETRDIRGNVEENSNRVEQSRLVINQTVTGTMTLAEDMKGVSRQMALVKEATDSITGILKIIEDISEKTHVLATNASIEAAHAGEAGKGFAVVASEVRNLSRHTAESVTLIEETVKNAGGRINETFQLIQNGQTNADNLMKHISGSQTAMDSIIRSFSDIGSRINGLELVMEKQEKEARTMTEMSDEVINLNSVLSGAIESQMKGYMKISGVIGNAAEYSRNNSIASGQLAELGQELNKSSFQLKELLGQFILKEDFIYENRRNEPREPLFYSIRFDIGNNKNAGSVLDISDKGLKVQWNEHLHKGDSVSLTIHLPLIYRDWAETLDLKSTIMWQNKDSGLVFAGLRITDIDDSDREILQKMVYDMKRKLEGSESSSPAERTSPEPLEELEELEEL